MISLRGARGRTKRGGTLSLVDGEPRNVNSTTVYAAQRQQTLLPYLTSGVFSQEPLPGDATPGCPGRGSPSARMVLPGSQDPSSQPGVICFQVFCPVFMYSMWTDYEVCRRIRAAPSLVSRGDSEIPSLATQGWHSLGCAEGRLCSMALVFQYLGCKRSCNQLSWSWCCSQGTAQAQSQRPTYLNPPAAQS